MMRMLLFKNGTPPGLGKAPVRTHAILTAAALMLVAPMLVAFMVSLASAQASDIPAAQLINPNELVKILQSSQDKKPLLIDVGSHVLFQQAHIPGSEYIGPASSPDGLQQLRKRLEKLPRSKFIVIYCGCCPWNHCPNVKPASDALRDWGFTNVKVLYIASNFGADWVNKGYPVASGG